MKSEFMRRVLMLALILNQAACSTSSFKGSQKQKNNQDGLEDEDAAEVEFDSGKSHGEAESDGTLNDNNLSSIDNILGDDIGDEAHTNQGSEDIVDTSDTSLENKKPDPQVSNKFKVEELPGVESIRVGINFEDTIGGDADFNDAVMCFTGKFKINGGVVTSLEEQTVQVDAFSQSGCRHNMHIEIKDLNKNKEYDTVFQSRNTQLTLPFKVGSQLYVTMIVTSGNCTDADLSDYPRRVITVPDVCNN